MSTHFEAIASLIRKSLEAGQTVDIEGLGTFRLSAQGYQFVPQTAPQVFVAYAVEDLALAGRLCDALQQAGFSPWLDKAKLLPGQNWPRAIERAIEMSDAFVPCFSRRSVAKRGQFQSELRYALECARKRPLEETFLIPVRFEECAVPARISENVQYVDLFPDWEKGLKRVCAAVRKTARPLLSLR